MHLELVFDCFANYCREKIGGLADDGEIVGSVAIARGADCRGAVVEEPMVRGGALIG